MIKKLTCIECPKGCALSVDIENCKVVNISGARCPRGVEYAHSEGENPRRIFTSTVIAVGMNLKLVPVRTDKPIPKKDILRAAQEAKKIRINSPLKSGDTIVENFLGSGVKLIATREVSLYNG
jgi:CxxC motif-containing protein